MYQEKLNLFDIFYVHYQYALFINNLSIIVTDINTLNFILSNSLKNVRLSENNTIASFTRHDKGVNNEYQIFFH